MDDLDSIMRQLNDLKLEDNPDNPEADLTEKLASLSVDESPFGKSTQEVIKKIDSGEGVPNIVELLTNSDLTEIAGKDLGILYTTEEEKLVLISLIGSGQLLTMEDAPLDKMIDWNLINLLMNLIKNSEDPTVKVEITKSFSTLFKNNECALEMLLMEGFLQPVIENGVSSDETLKIVSFQILHDICHLNERYIQFLLQTGGFPTTMSALNKAQPDSDLQALIGLYSREIISKTESFSIEEISLFIEDLTLSLSNTSRFDIQQNLIWALSSGVEKEFEYNAHIKYKLKPLLEKIHSNLDAEDSSHANLIPAITEIVDQIKEKEEEDKTSIESEVLKKQEEIFSGPSDDMKIIYIRLLSLNIIESEESITELTPNLMVLINSSTELEEKLLPYIIEALDILLDNLPVEAIIEMIKATEGDLGSFGVNNLFAFAGNRRIFHKLIRSLEKYGQIYSHARDNDQKVFDLYKELLDSIPQKSIYDSFVDASKKEIVSAMPQAKALLDHLQIGSS